MKKTCTITGSKGFIGGALKKRLESMGWKVYPMPRCDVDYMFLFGSPSSDHWFSNGMSYNIRETIDNFINAIDYCREHHIKLVYPSSATVYNGNTAYAKCKGIIEVIASCYSQETLGLRIFAGYGVGEEQKGEYASIVYKFARDMKAGRQPVIWGDGTQTRDFIYIDDIVTAIIDMKDLCGTVDVGTGINTSFKKVIQIINKQISQTIVPVFSEKPSVYVQKTICHHPCVTTVSLEEGIQRILESL